MSYHRRDFIKVGAMALAGSVLPLKAMAALMPYTEGRRSLAFYNTHTAEKILVCYYDRGVYDPKALDRINYILRDHRTGSVKPIDLKLLDVLHKVKCRVGYRDPVHVISGYRTPKTNDMLRRITSGVAKASLHTKGQAIDIRLPGYSTAKLRDVCIDLQTGGVGYYPRSNFVHLDTGIVRDW